MLIFQKKTASLKKSCIWGLFLVFTHALAENEPCILLGKQPSFILQMKNKNLQFTPNQDQLLKNIKGPLQFTQLKKMSQERYLIFFQALQKNSQIRPGCYHPDKLAGWIKDIKRQNPEIDELMPNLILRVMGAENPEYVISGLQWNLLASPGGIQINDAWKLLKHQGHPKVTVAILDTGILENQSLNPNLLYAVFDGQQYQWRQGPNDAQNAGVNFTDNNNTWSLGASPSCQKCSASEHGTHVAGVIASSGNMAYGEQVFGVAPSTTILPINVFSKIDDPDICSGFKNTPCTISYSADQLNAQSWLAGQPFSNLPPAPKVKVINMSLGGFGGCSRIAQENFNRLLQKKISIIVAAGNSNIDASQTYPAGCPQVLAIAATGPSGEKAWYSNWGNSIALAAPGGNSVNPLFNQPNNQIYSTVAHAYKFLQGTSMAAPMVSGVVALMYSISPNLNQAKVLQLLSQPQNMTPFPKEEELPAGLTSCTSPKLNLSTCGYGIVNAAKTIAYMLRQSS